MDETFENAERIGYPKYEISRSGEVRNAITKKLYKPQMHRRGYLWVPMQRPEGGWFCEYIHQLVARMYIPNPHRKPQVNHIDGDKQNNVVENLEWVTNVENARHAMKHGLMPHAIINEEKVHEICKLFEKGKLPTEVSKITKVPRTTVYAIWYRRNWVDISSKYDFKQSYHQNKRMTEETMHTVCKMLCEGLPCPEISAYTGVSVGAIQKVSSGKNCRHISEQYPYFRKKFGLE